ncbi:D-beta-hydroxybutyrate dehydrogenase (EC [Amycolatopsis camponoti]|uniref:D-beta-hydroxybutyrate dehydrogenase (EC) n=1 Tax=Amycolatopsis camponoti TaxID=2606593 RepID=A0A6I8LI82_9PSEU|nr:D-beta-hydroxybutyrate dehydrogenase (EC [Amycolatopsis camponoti]
MSLSGRRALVAGAVAYLCSPEAASVSGTELVLDGGWSAS